MAARPKIGFTSLKAVARIVCGDAILGSKEIELLSPYRSQRELDEFFFEDLGFPADPAVEGSSRCRWTESWLKAKNGTDDLRKMIEGAVRPADYVQTEFSVEKAVEHLNEHLRFDRLRLVRSGGRYVLSNLAGVSLAPPETAPEVLSDAYVQELSHKCDAKLADGDFDGAITNGRTLVEAILVELEKRLAGTRSDYEGNLQRQFKAVAKLLRLDAERPDLDDRFKDVIRGLVSIVNGLAPLRNKMSDGHAREKKPAPHHAQVVVNAAKTVALFLVQSYEFQVSTGKLVPKTSDQVE